MGYEGTSEGLRVAGFPVVELDCEARVKTGDKEGALAPDVMALFSDGGLDLVPYAARRACVKVHDMSN